MSETVYKDDDFRKAGGRFSDGGTFIKFYGEEERKIDRSIAGQSNIATKVFIDGKEVTKEEYEDL